MNFLIDLLVKMWETFKKIVEIFFSFIFCVWELIVISCIITILCGVLFYKVGVFDNFGETYANELLPNYEPLKTYFYIDFKETKPKHK